MVSSAAAISLPDDVQRAIQQAVGNVNNAAVHIADANPKTHKMSKRQWEEGQDLADGDGGRVKKKKKTKKHGGGAARDGDASASAAAPLEQGSTSVSAAETTTTPGSSGGSGETTPGEAEAADAAAAAPAKKKKKKKGKERAQDVPAPQAAPASHPHPQPGVAPPCPLMAAGAPVDLATSSADFLSAVVAAASATAGHAPQGGPSFEQAMQQYMAYPTDFDPYAYPGPPPPHPPHAHPHPPLPGQPPFPLPFPDAAGILPDLNFTSSEELLRCLHEFDLSKVVTVLKSLGEAAAAANVQLNVPPLFLPGPGSQAPPPSVQQQPVRSDAILRRPPKQKKGKGVADSGNGGSGGDAAVAAASDAPAPLQPDNPDHAHMLANVWMNPAKLKELVRTEGLVYKKGKFSATEDAQLAAAIEQYRVTKSLSPADLDQIIFSNKLGKEKGHESFWSEITSALQLRPIIAVYHHVRRTRHPFAGKGTWTKTEDDLLLQSVQELGQQWEKISDIVQRTAADCRDRYRNHLQDRSVRRTGTWTKEEEEELTRIVTEMTLSQGKDMDTDIFWGVVSQRMGGKRGRQQCRIKWTDSLAPQIKNTGERPRWSAMDAYILVHKVDSLSVRDDTEIDWKLLPDENWNIWSAHSLQRRWLTMKRGIKGFEEMSHAEIMEILKTKKAQSPPPSSSGRKKKSKYLSAEAVSDMDDYEMQPQAGSSTGPGTIASTVV